MRSQFPTGQHPDCRFLPDRRRADPLQHFPVKGTFVAVAHFSGDLITRWEQNK
jgi:hypothetical protein